MPSPPAPAGLSASCATVVCSRGTWGRLSLTPRSGPGSLATREATHACLYTEASPREGPTPATTRAESAPFRFSYRLLPSPDVHTLALASLPSDEEKAPGMRPAMTQNGGPGPGLLPRGRSGQGAEAPGRPPAQPGTPSSSLPWVSLDQGARRAPQAQRVLLGCAQFDPGSATVATSECFPSGEERRAVAPCLQAAVSGVWW